MIEVQPQMAGTAQENYEFQLFIGNCAKVTFYGTEAFFVLITVPSVLHLTWQEVRSK